MALNVGTITAKFEANVTDLQRGINTAQREVQSLGNGFASAGGSIGAFFDKAGQQAKSLTSTLAYLGTAGLGVVALGAKSAVKEFMEQEEVGTKLEKVVLNLNGATQKNVQQLKDQATALERVGVYSDDVIMSAQAQLATFDLTSDSIATVIPGLLDMMVAERGVGATMEDAKQIAQGLGKAFQGQFDVLKKQGFIITDAQEKVMKLGNEQEKAATINDILGATYKHLNEEMAKTFTGQMQIAMNIYDKFMGVIGESIAGKLEPLIKKFTEWYVSVGYMEGVINILKNKWSEFKDSLAQSEPLQFVVGKLKEFGDWAVANKDTIITFLQGFGGALLAIAAMTATAATISLILSPLSLIGIAAGIVWTHLDDLKKIWEEHSTLITSVAAVITTVLLPALALLSIELVTKLAVNMANSAINFTIMIANSWKAVAGFIAHTIQIGLNGVALAAHVIALGIAAVTTGVMTAATWLLNTAMVVLTGPIGAVILIIGLLIAAGVALYKNWDVVKEYAAKTGAWIAEVWEKCKVAVTNAVQGIYDGTIGKFQEMYNKVKEIGEKIRHAISDAFDKDKRNSPSIADKINDLKGFVEENSFGFTPNVVPASASTVNQTINANINNGMDLNFLGEKMSFAMRSNY